MYNIAEYIHLNCFETNEENPPAKRDEPYP